MGHPVAPWTYLSRQSATDASLSRDGSRVGNRDLNCPFQILWLRLTASYRRLLHMATLTMSLGGNSMGNIWLEF